MRSKSSDGSEDSKTKKERLSPAGEDHKIKKECSSPAGEDKKCKKELSSDAVELSGGFFYPELRSTIVRMV